MRNILATTGLVLLASIVAGCASSKTGKELDLEYVSLKDELTAYEPVGDAKIDGLARPFVTDAMKLKDEVDRENAKWKANDIYQIMGSHKPEDCAKAYAALGDQERAKVDAAVAAAKKADASGTKALISNLADLAVAGAKLTIEIKDAAGGGRRVSLGLQAPR